jgi:hypothetical protein
LNKFETNMQKIWNKLENKKRKKEKELRKREKAGGRRFGPEAKAGPARLPSRTETVHCAAAPPLTGGPHLSVFVLTMKETGSVTAMSAAVRFAHRRKP